MHGQPHFRIGVLCYVPHDMLSDPKVLNPQPSYLMFRRLSFGIDIFEDANNSLCIVLLSSDVGFYYPKRLEAVFLFFGFC